MHSHHRQTPCVSMLGFALGLLMSMAIVACSDDSTATTPTQPIGTTAAIATTVAEVTTTTAPATTTAVAPKTPAESVDELVAALYAALDTYDDTALRALSTDPARHGVYFYGGSGHGEITANFAVANYRLASSGIESIEILGPPLVSGDAVAIPVRYLYAEGSYVGYDVIITEPQSDGGLLVAGGVTFLADADLTADPNALSVLQADVAAHNAGNPDGVLATMHDDAAFWDSFAEVDPATLYTGQALRSFMAGVTWFSVEMTADPITSGPFIAVPNHLSAGLDGSEGISIFLVRDGKIALHAYAP